MNLSKLPRHKMAFATGSRVICDPPPMDTDEDWVVLVGDLDDFEEQLKDSGWLATMSDEYGEGIRTYRKDILNLVVTDAPQVYSRWRLATLVARRLNLLRKEDRIMVFQAILYGAVPQDDYADKVPATI